MKNLPEKIAELWGWAVILMAFIGLSVLMASVFLYLLGGLIGVISGIVAVLLGHLPWCQGSHKSI